MLKNKESNPKDALGIKKVSLHLVPVKPLLEVGLAMLEGGRKYGTHNYRSIGVRMSTYYNAAMRHLMSWWEGEDIDPDSGIHHVVKAMASLFVVRDGMHMGNCVDDRPPQYPEGVNMDYFNGMAAAIIEKYPDCAKPFLEITNILTKENNKEITAITQELKRGPAEDEMMSPYNKDGMEFCAGFGCLERGFPKRKTGNYNCPEHKETKDE